MATVRAIVTDAYTEIGVLGVGQSLTAEMGQLALLRFENQIDAWAADRLTLSIQSATAISWPSATSTRTIGPSGADITAQRPVFINQMNYVIPSSSPAVEVAMGPMDVDQYAALTIKGLQSGLPQLFFYQTDLTTVVGTIFIWPQPTTTITLNLYAPKAVTVPTTLDDILLGPPGYQEAYMYQLALRLCGPFGVPIPQGLPTLAREAFANMKRPNVDPGLLGIDTALVPTTGGGYNVYSDSVQQGGNR